MGLLQRSDRLQHSPATGVAVEARQVVAMAVAVMGVEKVEEVKVEVGTAEEARAAVVMEAEETAAGTAEVMAVEPRAEYRPPLL